MREVENAFGTVIGLTEQLPFAESVSLIHNELRSLAAKNFLNRKKPWLNAFELAAIAKLVYLNASDRRSTQVDLGEVLNAYKRFWAEVDSKTVYPTSPEFIASFVLRFAYQQIPINVNARKMQHNFERTLSLFGGSSKSASVLRDQFERSAGLKLEDFLKIAHVLYELFIRNSSLAEHVVIETLQNRFSQSQVTQALNVLSTTRSGFRKYHASISSSVPSGTPYEFNPLLRFPIVMSRNRYWCVFPEFINYAATRGLYFFIADQLGQQFSSAFADSLEEYVSTICIKSLGQDHVITEREERDLGWSGKTNDVTLIFKDIAVLFECKNSGLFSLSKRSGAPIDLKKDIQKNLVNADKRKGLFQLYDKIDCIARSGIPERLKVKYSNVKRFYPVILLHDEIWFANRPETLKNLIDEELKANGICGFEYQIWHIEEFEILLKAVPPDQIPSEIERKFTSQQTKTWDLSSHLSNRYGLEDLRISLFVPHGESQPFKILRTLIDSNTDISAL
jgi:hypothetical protein